MADFEIPENPDFVESVRKFEPTDPAHADLFNRVILALLESLAYLRKYKADMDYVDSSYQQGTGYTDKKIADLINGAPETLDTLKEIADAIAENKTIVEALDSAIGKKANQTELDTHTGNNVIHITSAEHEGLTEAIKHTKTAHVTGVKGSAESIYRTGDVEITAENVGLGNVDNTADSEKSVNYAESAGNAAKVNGHNVNADVPSDAKFTDTDTWRPLGTTADTACAGNDSRLSNARPASDVYAWAKASTKPAYNKAEVGLGNVDDTADSTKSVNYAASAGNAAKVNGHSVNADVPSDAKFTDTKGTCLSGRSSSYGWSVNRLPSDYLIEAFHTAAKDYSMTSPYGNMYWASFEITIPQSNNIKFFDAINITPFATSGLISVSITNYTTSKIQGFVFSPLAETKSISFHVTLHGTAS
nr:MAG TPA: hypothetical protein [Caudoviricetes sp.]